MTALLLLTALTSGREPPGAPVDARVDLVDVNHLYDPENGKENFTQLVYHAEQDGDLRIVAWRLRSRPGMVPMRRGRFLEAVWLDGGVLRRVRCRTVVESWAVEDYEMKAREAWPIENRRELGR